MEPLHPAFEYHSFNERQQAASNSLRLQASDLARFAENEISASAERTLGIRKLEEAIMWLNKAISLDTRDE